MSEAPLRDPAFPGLGTALDPASMLEIFRERLQPAPESPWSIRDCRISRLRYRRAERCILQYEMDLHDPTRDRKRRTWVTGVMYAGDRTRRKWEKLREAAREFPVLSPFEPYSYLSELKMLVQAFPHDRRLPTLPLLMAGDAPEIASLISAWFGPGDWNIEVWRAEPVRYRAELGATLRLTVRARDKTTGSAESHRCYAKVFARASEAEQTFRTLRMLSESSPGFIVANLIACPGGLRALLQEEVEGVSLVGALRGGSGRAAARVTARALAELHQSSLEVERRHTARDEAGEIERTGRLLRWACPHLERRIEAGVETIVSGLEDTPRAPAHLDLKPEHVLLHGDRPALVDLDWFAHADPVLDAANLLAHIVHAPLLDGANHEFARTAAEAFAGEYFDNVPEQWRSRLPVHYAGAVLKISVGLFRRQEPNWTEKIPILLSEVEESLAEDRYSYTEGATHA